MLQWQNKQHQKNSVYGEKALPYSLHPMRKEDVTQVNEIDREVFPAQWPPANYRHDLQNQFAHYVVACDETETVAETGVRTRPEHGRYTPATRIRRWLGRFFGNKNPSSGGKPIITDRSHTPISVSALGLHALYGHSGKQLKRKEAGE